MIGTLLRLDPSIRGTWVLALFGISGGFLLRSIARRLPDDLSSLSSEASGWLTFSVLVAYLSCLLVLIFQNSGTRTSRFFLGLPVSARTLWWVRMTALLWVGVVPISLATVIVAARFHEAGSGLQFENSFLLMGAKACTGLMLAAVLFQLPDAKLQRIPPRASYVLYLAFVSLLLILFVSLAPAHPVVVGFLLTITMVLLFYLHRSIPQSFLLHPAEPGEEDWSVPSRTLVSSEGAVRQTDDRMETIPGAQLQPGGQTAGVGPHWTVHKTIARLLLGHWQSWLLAPLIFMYSALLWDAYQSPHHPLANILFVTAWLFVLSYQVIIRLYRLDHLPIPRGALFPYLFFASVLPVLLGVGAGALLLYPRESSECKVCVGSSGVEVPPAFWELTLEETPPEVVAPWGEKMVPTRYPVYPGSRISAYSPFEFNETHSARFVALQANRAVTAVHGSSPFSAEDIAADSKNPLVEQMTRRHEFRRGLPIEQSLGRASPVRARTWMLGAVVVIWICGLMAVFWLLQFRPSPLRPVFKWLFVAALGFWGGLLLLAVLSALFSSQDPLSSVRVPMILARHAAESLPLGLAAYWVAAFLSLGLFYGVLFQIFKGIEAPLGKVRPVWKEYG